MPLARLRHSHRVSREDLNNLADAIPLAVAEAFACAESNGDLLPEEVEVEVSTVGPWDRNVYDIGITVLANSFQSRRVNLDERRQQIQTALAPLVPVGMTGYLWVLLCPASFGEFNKG